MTEIKLITKPVLHKRNDRVNFNYYLSIVLAFLFISCSSNKIVIYTSEAPAPIGPYSQAILINNTLYISGQIALDPQTGEIINGDIISETHRVMKNISAILSAAGMSFDNVVKSTIYIRNIEDFPTVNKVYSTYLSNSPPARETIEVSHLPKNVNVEISMIAVK